MHSRLAEGLRILERHLILMRQVINSPEFKEAMMGEDKGKRQDSPDNLRGKERADEVHRRNEERKAAGLPPIEEEPTEQEPTSPAEGEEKEV